MVTATGRALVIGGTGNVGSEMVKVFRANNWDVTATFRSDGDRKTLERLGAQPVALDVTNQTSLREFSSCIGSRDPHDVMIMNVGTLKGTPGIFEQVNVQGPLNVAKSLAAQGKLPDRFIQISSQLVGGTVINEQARYRPGGMWASDSDQARRVMSHYAISKAKGEKLLYDLYREQKGTTDGFVVLRPGLIMGPNDTATKALVTGMRLLRTYFNLTDHPNPEISVILNKDVARVVLAISASLMLTPSFGIFDLENGQNGVSAEDFCNAGKLVFGKNVQTRKIKGIYEVLARVQDWIQQRGVPTDLDNSRVVELQNPRLATSNERLVDFFFDLREMKFATLEEILKEVS